MKRKNVLVSAYFAQNVGDDLFLKSLFDRYENVNWYLLTSNKRYEKMFESYSHVNTFFSYREVMNINMFISWARLVNHFKKYDAFIKIGGSIFMQNKEWEKTFERRHQLMNILKKHNIPTFIIGANFGPYEDEIFKKKYEDYFINYDYICFRDSYSYNLFKHLSNVSKAPDAVLTLNVKKQRQQANCIGISPISLQARPDLKSYANRYYKKIGEIIVHYLKQNNIVKLFSFCQYEGDEESIEHILQFVPKRYKNKIIIVNYEGQLDLFLEAFQQCTKVIGTRFHSLILAMKFKQSFLPIIYSDKTVNSFKMIGVQHIGYHIRHIDSLNVKKINHLFNDSINDAIYTDAEKQFFGLDEILKVPNR